MRSRFDDLRVVDFFYSTMNKIMR